MNYIKRIVCPHGCDSRFIAEASVKQNWYVGEYGEYLGIANDWSEVLHRPDFNDEFYCENCGTVGIIVSDPDTSAQQCCLSLDFDKGLDTFYNAILGGIPDGYMVCARKVRVSKPDFMRIRDTLERNYIKMVEEQKPRISNDELSVSASMAMYNAGLGVDDDLEEGTVRLMDGFLIKEGEE